MATAGAPWSMASACACACMPVYVHVGTHAHGHLKWPQAARLHANPRTGNPGAGWVPAPQLQAGQSQLARGRAHISMSLFKQGTCLFQFARFGGAGPPSRLVGSSGTCQAEAPWAATMQSAMPKANRYEYARHRRGHTARQGK